MLLGRKRAIECSCIEKTFGFEAADYDLIEVGGTDFTITATPDAIIDGNGQAWWDGLGSNGGIAKCVHVCVPSPPNRTAIVQQHRGLALLTNPYCYQARPFHDRQSQRHILYRRSLHPELPSPLLQHLRLRSNHAEYRAQQQRGQRAE